MNNLTEPVQPNPSSWKFVEELAMPVDVNFNWNRKTAKNNEADLSRGIQINTQFPDRDDALKTAFDDLNSFFETAGIKLDGTYKIIFEKAETECFEAYRIDIKTDCCVVQADDTEGIRRAVYYLEDILQGADGPFLETGVIERKPWLKSRISRCFFGPIKRPPFNRDELLDDVDYYPAEYLNRLAHEGINGLWLTIVFSDLCKTSIFDLPSDAEKRLAKLRRTVEKCLRYGIKTYIFCIEPRAMENENPVLINNPELKGAKAWNGRYCFCPFSDTAQKYLYESVNWIFGQVPGLGGMINISYGERPTTCASTAFGKDCPVCSKKTPGEILAASLQPMEKGMHDAAPGAELISWFYVPENYTGGSNETAELMDIAEKLPENVVMQYNFESGGSKVQLGKERHAGDYWLSYVGPSGKYKSITGKAAELGREISAKIQVSCSHEVATVPLIPVPGLLYQKYKAMHELGVSHVMQCWYFGNYPGIMNKAAGSLAFEDFKDSEEDFLRRLARPQWNKSAEQVMRAWSHFTDAYSNYPLENMFQYYGPMHDGVVWPLYLEPADEPLAPTWRLDYGTSGDRYGECLGRFTIDEVLALCSSLSNEWHKGLEILQELKNDFAGAQECLKDIILVQALDIQFKSGLNILEFYKLRDELLKVPGKAGLDILSRMQEIVNDEISNSGFMVELCVKDSRLGFHPEAEGYKYFPEKLKWRIMLLNSLLENDFPAAKKRLNAGQGAFVERETKSYICNSGKYEYNDEFAWKADFENGKLKVCVDDLKPADHDKFGILIESKPFCAPEIFILENQREFDLEINGELKEIGFNIFKFSNMDIDDKCPGWIDFVPRTIRLALGTVDNKAKGKLILLNNSLQIEKQNGIIKEECLT